MITNVLHLADFIVLALYFLGVMVMGLWMARRINNFSEFVMPRRFGKVMMMMHTFGTGTHSDQAVAVAAKTYSNGLSGIWYQWLWLFATPFYWLIAPMMRRFRALTTADVFEARYDRSVSMLYAVVSLGNFVVSIGIMLKGSSAVIDACTGRAWPADWAILMMTILFVVYGTLGGLGAAIVTDFLQGLLTILFSFLLLPFLLEAVGGLAGMRASIPNIVEGKDMFTLVAPDEISWFYVTVIAFNGLVGIVTQPHIMSTCGAGKTELEGQIGFMGGSLIKRFCTVAWCLTGLSAVAYFSGNITDPDQVFGQVAHEFLPQISPGLLGLFIAALVASVMSSCDSFMIASAGLFTENLYQPLLSGKSQRHYLGVARISSLLVVAGGVIFAYWLESVVYGLEIFWKISPMMAVAFWLGIFWRRATSVGAWASTLAAFSTWWLTTQNFFIHWIADFSMAQSLQLVVEVDNEWSVYLPWQMLMYLAVGLIAGVAASFLSQSVDHTKLEKFYALTRTPIRLGEQVQAPCTLPVDAKIGRRQVFWPNSQFEIPIPSARAIVGFLVGWLFVGGIIGGFAWIIST